MIVVIRTFVVSRRLRWPSGKRIRGSFAIALHQRRRG